MLSKVFYSASKGLFQGSRRGIKALSASAENMFVPNDITGFLPKEHPITELPEPYGALNDILTRATLYQPDGSFGLLHDCQLGPTVDAEMPDIPCDHLNENTDPHLLWALFRDYSYLASEYLLEPCDYNFRNTGDYGLAREVF